MKLARVIAFYVLIGVIVICMGALAGWYFVLRSNSDSIQSADAARGFGSAAPIAGINGSTFQNMARSFMENGKEIVDITRTYSPSQNGSNGDSEPSSGSRGASGGTQGTDQARDAASTQSIVDTNYLAANSTTTATSSKPTTPRPKTPRLWHVSQTPIGGAGFGFASTSLIYYTERAGGYVFKAHLYTGEILRLSNTLRAKTYESYFDRSGHVIMRSLNPKNGATQTFAATITAQTNSQPGSLSGSDLETGITDLSISPETGNIFYTSTDGARTVGTQSRWDGAQKDPVFSVPMGNWRPFILSDGRVFIAQKPADGISGFAYEVKKDGKLEPLVRDVPGLTVLPQSNTTALLYSSSENGLSLFVKESAAAPAVQLPIKTTSDKCVWGNYPAKPPSGARPPLVAYCAVPVSPQRNFLDRWYRGATHSADTWWQIDVRAGTAKVLFAPSTQGASIDVVDPQIDPTGSFILFKDGADASLWSLRIVQ